MSAPILSVIIPTHKRAAILRVCLEHLARQTVADQMEVIVVSDGHDEETSKLCGQWRMANNKSLRKFEFFEVPKSQQGIARNRGVREAQGKYVLFIGDDIFLAPNTCETHLKAQSSQLIASAVLGFTTWDPACRITRVMSWLEQSGWQFGYPMIAKYAHGFIPANDQHRFTYTSHISLPTEIAKKFPFREDVTMYGWEDVEWGLRLRDASVTLFYEPDAKALHHHHIELEDSLKRMETLGRSAVIMERHSAAFLASGFVPRGWKRLKYRIAAMLPGIRGKHAAAFLNASSDSIS